MALPKKRHSTRRKGKRRAAKGINLPAIAICSNCKKPKKPHTVCPNCGFYNGQEIIDMTPKAVKKSAEKTPRKENDK